MPGQSQTHRWVEEALRGPALALLAIAIGVLVARRAPLLCVTAGVTVMLVRATAFRGERSRRTDDFQKGMAAGLIAAAVWGTAAWVLHMAGSGGAGSPPLTIAGGLSTSEIAMISVGGVLATTLLLIAADAYARRRRHRRHRRHWPRSRAVTPGGTPGPA